MKILKYILFATAVGIAQTLKVVMMSDLHFNPWYNATVGNVSYCAYPMDRVDPHPP